MWQEIIVGLCIFAAFLFVVRQYWPGRKKKSAGNCDHCSSCNSPCDKRE